MPQFSTLNVPISMSLSDHELSVDFEHPRITVRAADTSDSADTPHTAATADLTLEEAERAIFEATDFVAYGTTYRVRATATTKAGEQIEWERVPGGCRSPYIDGPAELDVTFEAVPATVSAAKSTTHTTVIIKKGKPFPLEL